MTRTAIVVTSIYWIIIGGLVAALLFSLWKNRREKNSQQQHGRPKQARRDNNLSGYGSPRNYVPKPINKQQRKKHTNVIPFKKKRDSKSKAEPD